MCMCLIRRCMHVLYCVLKHKYIHICMYTHIYIHVYVYISYATTEYTLHQMPFFCNGTANPPLFIFILCVYNVRTYIYIFIHVYL